jgi:hypothetical protein
MATKPFYGDPASSAPVFGKYAVLLSGLTSTIPTGTPAGTTLATMGFILNDPAAGTPVTTEWDPVGALADDNPFDDGEESIDVTPHSAAGLGVYAKTYKNQEERVTFTAKETTLVTLGILFDASDLTDTSGTISGKLKQRDPSKKYRVGFVRANDTTLERRVSENFAQIDSISRSFGDGEALRTVTLTVVPDFTTTPPTMYDYYLGPKA